MNDRSIEPKRRMPGHENTIHRVFLYHSGRRRNKREVLCQDDIYTL